MNGAIARIILRYGAGFALGRAMGEQLAADPDLVMVLALAVGAGVEFFYALAKKRGWSV